MSHDAVVASDPEIALSTLRTKSGNVECVDAVLVHPTPLIVLTVDTEATRYTQGT